MTALKQSLRPILATLLFLILLRTIPLIFPVTPLWGLNHLIFVTPFYAVAVLVLAALVLAAALVPPIAAAGHKSVAFVSELLFESSAGYRCRLAIVAAAGMTFFLFPMPTHFLGDGYALLSHLAAPVQPFIKWTESGINYILNFVQMIFGPRSDTTALSAFRALSVLSGIITIWFYFLIARESAEDRSRRLFIFCTLLFSGSLLLFFGYVENYPLLHVCMTGFIYYSLRYLKTGVGLAPVALFLAAGIILHLQMAVFLPAFFYIFFAAGRGRRLYGKHRIIIWAALILTALFSIALFILKITGDLYFQNMFLPPFKGKPIDPSYYLFSPAHLLDCINQLLLLSPLLPLLILLAGKNFFHPDTTTSKALALMSIGTVAFLFLIDPTLSMPRDWDLFSLSAFPLTLYALTMIPHGSMACRQIVPVAIFLLILFSLPYLAVNLKTDSSVRYVEYFAGQNKPRSMTTYMNLRDWLKMQGQNEHAENINRTINANYPHFRHTWATLAALDHGDLATAERLINTIPPDKYSLDFHRLWATYYLKKGMFARALDESEKAIQLQEYYDQSYPLKAEAEFNLNKRNDALATLRRGHRLNRDNPLILLMLGQIFVVENRYDSAVHYLSWLVKSDSDNAEGYYLLSGAFSKMGRVAEARKSAERYQQLGKSDPLFEYRYKELQPLLKAGSPAHP